LASQLKTSLKDSGSGGLHGLSFPLSQKAKDAIAGLNSGSNNFVALVTLKNEFTFQAN
jgi:hypothetical protein